MRVRFLLGPAGSGKTFRCLAEIRARLTADPLGPPLILLAPRQATYQLEVQLLAGSGLKGYTRLQILPFDRFAAWLLERLATPPQPVLSGEGRVMVLRALLHRHHKELKAFGGSGRAPGFARSLSEQLNELQQHRVSPTELRRTAAGIPAGDALHGKLHDLALLLEEYRRWLEQRQVPDAGTLLEQAIAGLQPVNRDRALTPFIAGLWLDGLAELTPQEIELLAVVAPVCAEVTLAFCLEGEPREDTSWLSTWSLISQTVRRCQARIQALDRCEITTEILPREPQRSRFATDTPPVPEYRPASPDGQLSFLTEDGMLVRPLAANRVSPLASLEAGWTQPGPLTGNGPSDAIRLLQCADPEHEAVMAAREVLGFVQAGSRFRDCAVLLRRLDTHFAGLRRVFTRYGIPFFLDRRESVNQHPLAQLTRGALLTVQFNWRLTDWFGVLKSGLAGLTDTEVDELENAALTYGWEGARWATPLTLRDHPALAERCERLRRRIIGPFLELRDTVTGTRTGRELAQGLRRFWTRTAVEEQLQSWTTAADLQDDPEGATHLTVFDELQGWLETLDLAFHDVSLPLREWLPILDTGIGTLTVGAIPPAIDQVLVGAVDRSRNPDLKLAVVLGLNEGLFPCATVAHSLLTDDDRSILETARLHLRGDLRQRLGHERYLGYIACTRARERLVLSWSAADARGRPLNPSPFIDHVRRLFPQLAARSAPTEFALDDCVHPTELLAPLLREPAVGGELRQLPHVRGWLDHFAAYDAALRQDRLSPEAIRRLHGDRLKTSASRLEEFAACPFKHFVSASLRARERDRFEVDARKTGIFMHEVLRAFHQELAAAKPPLRWRDVSPAEARDRIARIAAGQRARVAEGVLAAHPRNVFAAESVTTLLQDFVAAVIDWMRTYQFDPLAVELAIGGEDADLPWWEVDLGEGRTLMFRGSVDRVDFAPAPDREDAVCLTVLDYKSGLKALDELKLRAGLQLQLPAYLAALCAVAGGGELLNGRTAIPAGMFYVQLRRPALRSAGRDSKPETTRGFAHTGRFSLSYLPLFDSACQQGGSGQFSYRLRQDGQPYSSSRELVAQEQLESLTRDARAMLRHMGREILEGKVSVDPYRKGADMPCTWCAYQAVCRINRWTHSYRPLKPLLTGEK